VQAAQCKPLSASRNAKGKAVANSASFGFWILDFADEIPDP
jgi:hypothetical protein